MVLECYRTLKMIELRPAMFTGENTLRSIYVYATGYYQALLDNRIESKGHSEEPFFDWVANRLGYYESTAGWVNMITAESIGLDPRNINWNDFLELDLTEDQHTKSIRRFYELLEEFINELKN
jgi:hypothetical protein